MTFHAVLYVTKIDKTAEKLKSVYLESLDIFEIKIVSAIILHSV